MELTRTLTISLAFLLSFLSAWLFPVFFPSFPLTYFAPFLIIVYYKYSLSKSLWLSLLCGLSIDLFSSYPRLGISAINYCLTSAFLYHQKRHFFEDRLSTLPIMTCLFSFFSTFLQAIILSIFDNSINFSLYWIFTDLLIMPIIDSFYAFMLFTLPGIFMPKPSKREYFL